MLAHCGGTVKEAINRSSLICKHCRGEDENSNLIWQTAALTTLGAKWVSLSLPEPITDNKSMWRANIHSDALKSDPASARGSSVLYSKSRNLHTLLHMEAENLLLTERVKNNSRTSKKLWNIYYHYHISNESGNCSHRESGRHSVQNKHFCTGMRYWTQHGHGTGLRLSMNSSVVKVKDVFSSQVCCFSSSAGTCGESSSYLRSVQFMLTWDQLFNPGLLLNTKWQNQVLGQLTLLGLCW